jgi:predicted nucleic acid-binding protein
LVALGDARDPRHNVVRRILETEPGLLVIPAPVTVEIDYLVRQRGGPGTGRRFLEDLAEGRFRVEGLTQEEHGLALALHDRYAALDLGLADLAVVVLAHRYRTRRILTFDERDFRSVAPLSGGAFVLLPSDR